MKKTIAILLACIMLIASVPFTVSAENLDIKNAEVIDQPYDINAGDTVTVKANASLTITSTITIKNGGNLTIEDGGSIIFANNGRLYNEGTVTVKNGGYINFSGTGDNESTATLYNAETGTISFGSSATGLLHQKSFGYNLGDIINIDNMTIDGSLTHYVTLPRTFKENYDYRLTWNRKAIEVTFEVGYFLYEEGQTDDAYTDIANYKKCDTETKVPVLHGEKLFVMITPKHDPDKTKSGNWIDPSRMYINAGSTKVNVTTMIPTGSDRASAETPEYAGVYAFTPSDALEVTVGSTVYKNIVKIFDITLPRTEAYYVITDNNDVDRVDVEFGKTLSFRVVLEPDYDKSEIYVYVNSLYQEPAEFGYYRIEGPFTEDGFATAGGVQNDLTITVMGVASNESKEQLSSFVVMIQEIFSIIQEIFEYFSSLFEGLGSLGGEATA